MSVNKTILTIILVMSNAFSLKTIAQKDYDDDQMVKMLTLFYVKYITECSNNMDNDLNNIKKKYCTKHLLKKMYSKKIDYDLILNAQDCDIRWIDNLVITKNTSRKNCFTISYISEHGHDVIVILKKKKDRYLISNILT